MAAPPNTVSALRSGHAVPEPLGDASPSVALTQVAQKIKGECHKPPGTPGGRAKAMRAVPGESLGRAEGGTQTVGHPLTPSPKFKGPGQPFRLSPEASVQQGGQVTACLRASRPRSRCRCCAPSVETGQ